MNDNDRAKLDFGLEDDPASEPPPLDPGVIKAVTQQAGYVETPKSARKPAAKASPRSKPEPAEPVLKRRGGRPKTGRIHLFSARIRADTNNAIYDYADRHEITLGEVLERAVSALEEKERKG